jgi:hypothetical protein
LILPYYAKKFSKQVAELNLALSKKKSSINLSTIQHFSKIWINNYIQNLRVISKRKDIYSLSDKTVDWKNLSFIFIGASPIIEEEVDYLLLHKHTFFILSSDTSSYYLYKKGLIPDAILSIDSGRGTAFHFREDLPNDIPIITWLGGNKEIFQRKNPIYLVYTTYPLDQIIVDIHKDLFLLNNPGLNISGMALAIAEKMNVLDFANAGISFTSYKGKTHCRGTGYEYFKLVDIKRTYTMEMYSPGNYKTEISKKNHLALDLMLKSRFGSKKFLALKPSQVHDFRFQKKNKLEIDINSFLNILNSENLLGLISRELALPSRLLQKYLK